jgi:acyl-CoA thioester hydrolase
MYSSKTKIRVRYAETDQMSVVHHANYYVYFEEAREDFIAGAGIRYNDMEKSGIMMPLIETHCKYYVGAKYDDTLIVETSMEELSAVKVVLQYVVTKESDGSLIAKGKTVQAFVNKDSFKILNLKKSYFDLWLKLETLK